MYFKYFIWIKWYTLTWLKHLFISVCFFSVIIHDTEKIIWSICFNSSRCSEILETLDDIQRKVYNTIEPYQASGLQLFSDKRNVALLFLFYKSFHSNCLDDTFFSWCPDYMNLSLQHTVFLLTYADTNVVSTINIFSHLPTVGFRSTIYMQRQLQHSIILTHVPFLSFPQSTPFSYYYLSLLVIPRVLDAYSPSFGWKD